MSDVVRLHDAARGAPYSGVDLIAVEHLLRTAQHAREQGMLPEPLFDRILARLGSCADRRALLRDMAEHLHTLPGGDIDWAAMLRAAAIASGGAGVTR